MLGVSRTVTEVELKSAYRKLAMQCHPDRNPNNPDAEERFKEVTEAYAILADTDKRSLYDRYGHAGVGSAAGAGGGFDGTPSRISARSLASSSALETLLAAAAAAAAAGCNAARICAKTSPSNLKRRFSARKRT